VKRQSADVVVIGGGAIGGWTAYFAATSGAERVVLLERSLVGQGASADAAGVVRAQGGSLATVRLGRWSVDFYQRQREEIGVDSGFRKVGYIILAVRHRDVEYARSRMRMQRRAGLDVRWVEPNEACALSPMLSAEGHRGGTYLADDGYIDPIRNIRAYCRAMDLAAVEVCEQTPAVGVRTRRRKGGGRSVTAVETPTGPISTERVVLASGAGMRALGRQFGLLVPVGAVRHHVVITAPHEAFGDNAGPMVIDLGAGLYWRPEDGGLLWGGSNAYERAGTAKEIDWPYIRRMQRRLIRLVPASNGLAIRKAWAATSEFTPDHLPVLGPALTPAGDALSGLTIASAAGHGMMWGPAVARVAADVTLEGRTDLLDVSELGMDRFDETGHSQFSDPVALPFPATFGEDDVLPSDV
jgi:sarcosine oxidase subunit beta